MTKIPLRIITTFGESYESVFDADIPIRDIIEITLSWMKRDELDPSDCELVTACQIPDNIIISQPPTVLPQDSTLAKENIEPNTVLLLRSSKMSMQTVVGDTLVRTKV